MRARAFGRGQEAVSPVIGTILILLIAVVGILLVMFWGLPAIQTIQDQAQFEAMVTQFQNVDGAIDDILKGTPEKATRVTFSIPEGQVTFDPRPSWTITLYPEGGDLGHRLMLEDWTDGDAVFDVVNNGTVANGTVPLPDGTITVALLDGVAETEIATLTTGAGWTRETVTAVQAIQGETVRIRLTDGTGVRAEAWILPLGRISYGFGTAIQTYRIDSEGSAVFSMVGHHGAMRQGPSAVREDANPVVGSPYLARFTLWGLSMVAPGDASAIGGSGRGEFPVLLSLRDNYLRVDGTRVVKAEIGATGDLADVWYAHFNETHQFKRWGGSGSTDTDGGVSLEAENAQTPFSLALIQPVLLLASGDRPQDLG